MPFDAKIVLHIGKLVAHLAEYSQVICCSGAVCYGGIKSMYRLLPVFLCAVPVNVVYFENIDFIASTIRAFENTVSNNFHRPQPTGFLIAGILLPPFLQIFPSALPFFRVGDVYFFLIGPLVALGCTESSIVFAC
jgi:hypothetical protein